MTTPDRSKPPVTQPIIVTFGCQWQEEGLVTLHNALQLVQATIGGDTIEIEVATERLEPFFNPHTDANRVYLQSMVDQDMTLGQFSANLQSHHWLSTFLRDILLPAVSGQLTDVDASTSEWRNHITIIVAPADRAYGVLRTAAALAFPQAKFFMLDSDKLVPWSDAAPQCSMSECNSREMNRTGDTYTCGRCGSVEEEWQ